MSPGRIGRTKGAVVTATPQAAPAIAVVEQKATVEVTAAATPGPAGASGRTIEIEIEAVGGAQAITMPAPFGGVQSLFRNGLRERMSSFSTVGNIVTLPGFTEAGDIISILYFPS